MARWRVAVSSWSSLSSAGEWLSVAKSRTDTPYMFPPTARVGVVDDGGVWPMPSK
jgi:hypothetical protein